MARVFVKQVAVQPVNVTTRVGHAFDDFFGPNQLLVSATHDDQTIAFVQQALIFVRSRQIDRVIQISLIDTSHAADECAGETRVDQRTNRKCG